MLLKTGDIYVFAGLLLLLQSLWFVRNPQANSQVKVILFLGALCIKVGFFHYFPFMQLWDEQFHALVAKNLIATPFHPQLYSNPVLPYDFTNWSGNATWLHKQPWFLWQMAASIKIFGNNLWGVRLPSILMGSLLPVLVFSLGNRVFNYRVGLFGGLFAATSFFLTWLAVGLKATDHNDVAFVFYVTASLWALARYTTQRGLKNALLVGLLVGISVLNKWLTGLFAFSVWGFWLLFDGNIRKEIRLWQHLFAAVILALVVFVPWQLYVLQAFPVEAQFEMAFNSRHFFEVLEGHAGPWHYHFSQLGYLYGLQELLGGWLVMGPALLALFWGYKNNGQMVGPWAMGVLFVYVFFAVAATKMPAFPFLTAAFWWLAMGALAARLADWLGKKNWLKFVAVPLFALALLFNTSFFDFNRVRNLAEKPYFKGRLHNHEILKNLDQLLPAGENWVVFNTASWEGSLAMFYSNRGLVVYDNPPTAGEVSQLQAAGYRIAIFVAPDLNPALLQYPGVHALDVGLVQHTFF